MDTDEERKNRYYGIKWIQLLFCLHEEMDSFSHFTYIAVFKVDTILCVLRHGLGFGIYVFFGVSVVNYK